MGETNVDGLAFARGSRGRWLARLLIAFFVVVSRADAAPPVPAMAHVAARTAEALGPRPGAAVFVAPLVSDEPAPRGAALAARIASLVGGALGERTRVSAEPASLAAAQSGARKAKVLVYVEPSVSAGQLRATTSVLTVVGNVWDRARQLPPTEIAHAFASAPIDAEVRSYLAPIPLTVGRVERMKIDERDVLALACADVNGDGGVEIVTVGRQRAAVGRLRGGSFVASSTAVLRDLSPVAPAPLREPLASVVVLSAIDRIDVGISDRARGLRLFSDLRLDRTLTGVPLATSAGDACVRFDGTTLAASLDRCDPTDAPFAPRAAQLDAMCETSVVMRDGSTQTFRATHDPMTGDLVLESGAARAVLPRSGAQVAIADLDGDGDPEILWATDALAPEPDALVVSTWHPGRDPVERARLPVPAGVRAIAACPPDGARSAAVLVSTTGELWVVR
jgi:hypothetical protein